LGFVALRVELEFNEADAGFLEQIVVLIGMHAKIIISEYQTENTLPRIG
jgi:hypothetical protein